MLRTNPRAPTKAPAASGAHVSIKAPRPGRPPIPPSGASSAPVLLPLKEAELPKGWRGGVGGEEGH